MQATEVGIMDDSMVQTDSIQAVATSVFNGIPNFRDFGGYPTLDGRRVREGRLFRSQAFGDATEEDLERLAGLSIRLVCDLRSQMERAQMPGRWPQGAEPLRMHMDIRTDVRAGHGEFIASIREQPNALGVERAMRITYRGMPAAFARALPELLEYLLDDKHLPAVIHCQAGKDRTGFICAVILHALGVDREHILKDYLLSAQRINVEALGIDLLPTFSAVVGVPMPADSLKPALDVRLEYIQEALTQVDTDYGSLDAYLEKAGRMTPQRLRRLREVLLQPG